MRNPSKQMDSRLRGNDGVGESFELVGKVTSSLGADARPVAVDVCLQLADDVVLTFRLEQVLIASLRPQIVLDRFEAMRHDGVYDPTLADFLERPDAAVDGELGHRH